jgi:acetyl/propionyl-CoA carboxylase alpha subunit
VASGIKHTVGYESAGMVEFIVVTFSSDFDFMEMNT